MFIKKLSNVLEMIEFSLEIQLSAPKLISNHLKKNGSTVSWLARNLDIEPTYLCRCISGEFTLSEKNRQKINKFLHTDY